MAAAAKRSAKNRGPDAVPARALQVQQRCHGVVQGNLVIGREKEEVELSGQRGDDGFAAHLRLDQIAHAHHGLEEVAAGDQRTRHDEGHRAALRLP